MTKKAIIKTVNEIRELEAQKAELEKRISSLKADIQNEMKEAEELQAGNFLIRWTKVNSNRFDSKLFQSEHSRLFAKYVKQVESRRFSIAEVE